MSYFNGTPNGKLWLGSVKWSNDYQNVMNFDTKAKRDSFLKSKLKQVDTERVYMSKNGVITIDKYIKNIDKCNYCYFVNDSDISDEPYCCFITDYEYQAPSTTLLYVELDVFQMYYYDTNFYKSYIVRTHIPKAQDVVGRWVAPEPIGFPATVGKIVHNSTMSWSPAWNLNTVSTFGVGVGSSIPFKYGGYSVATTEATGGYSFPMSLIGDIEQFLSVYRDTALFQKSHLDEVINLTCVPQWVETICINNKIIGLDVSSEKSCYLKNPIVAGSEFVTGYNPKELACGYKPKNNKLYTSLCKVFVIHNKNGLSIPLKPELFDDEVINGSAKPSMWFTCRPLGLNMIKADVLNYKTEDSQFQIPYGASLGIGYNSNQGIAGFMNKFTAIGGLTASIGALSSGTASIAGAVGAATSTASLVNAFDSQYTQLGACSDVTSVSATFITPEYWDKSPTTEQCRIVDDYLTCYGYAYNEIGNVKSMATCRDKFNYIQTQNINMSCPAPATYESRLKSIFDSGVTLWHDYDVFGNYDIDNN